MVRATIGVTILILVALFILWFAVISPALERRRASKRAAALAEEPWEPQEIHRNKMTVIELIKPNCEPMQIGEAVPHHLPFAEYENKVMELWAEAEEVAAGKNVRRLRA